MARLGSLIKAAAVAGPVILKLVTTYGPELKRLREQNPDAFNKVFSSVTGMAKGRGNAKTSRAAHRRIEDIREQVVYLRDSADDDYERDRATLWNAQLDRLDSALTLVDSMGTEAREAELARINGRLDRLAGDVLAAFIDEQDEDNNPHRR